MGKEHRIAFELGVAIARYAGFRSYEKGYDFEIDLFKDYIRNLLTSLSLHDPDRLLETLKNVTEDLKSNEAGWERVRDFAIVVGKTIATIWPFEVGQLCSLGTLLAMFQLVLDKGGNKRSLDLIVSEVENTVMETRSHVPNNISQQILDLCKESKDISPQSPEANVIARNVVTIFESLPPILEIEREPTLQLNQTNPKKVFVVYGRDSRARTQMFAFLRSIGLEPIEWSQAIAHTGKSSPFIGEVLDAAFGVAQAVVVLLTGDDEARLKSEYQVEDDPDYEKNLTSQPRPNVLFEAGMAFGRHPDRTILVEVGRLRPFSDVAGRHSVRLSNKPDKRLELSQKLKDAGCEINITGADWLTAGELGS